MIGFLHEARMSNIPNVSSPSSSAPNFSGTAFLLADQARAIMLTTLLDGRALPAGELAYASGITAQTASSHLAKLLAGGLVSVETEGRHRYYRLAGAHVAQVLEHLAVIQPVASIRRKALSPQERQLQSCRCCYDHLAGKVGVAVTQALLERGYICSAADKQFEVTPAGIDWFGSMGLDVHAIKPTRRGLARQCLDWTERQHHLAGPLGVQFMRLLCAKGWLRRSTSSRAVLVTPKGCIGFKEQLGVETTAL
jgi:DNA-binding transcriptional ArsR family regulator